MRIRSAHLIAGGIVLGLAGWFASGQISAELAEPTDTASGAGQEQDSAFPVQVAASAARPTGREVVINARSEAARDVELRAETHGRVVGVDVARGGRVNEGDVIVRLDPRERAAVVSGAEATVRRRELEYQAATRLGEKGFQAETKIAEAKAALEAARADLERARIDLEHTTVEAPFAGIVELRPVEVGDYVDVGDSIATIIDQDPFLVVGDVAEAEVGRLEVGMAGDAELVTGEVVSGVISYIASRSDAATRTFRVELEVANPAHELPAGVSALLRLTISQVLAHRVPAALLTLDDQGRLGIKAVGADDRVRFHDAQIVRADNEHVWLAGLPEEVRLITVGHGFVRAGDLVRPVDDPAGTLRAPLVAERRS